MNADSEPIAGVPVKSGYESDFETVFDAQYARVTGIITSVVGDASRAEDLTVEVFWKLWHHPQIDSEHVDGWLYRTAIRMGLDELRRRGRREKYERLFSFFRPVPRPDQMHEANESRDRTRSVLASMKNRDASLLLLRSEEQTYEEIAGILRLNPASVGTLLRRAQEVFRKEYIKRYGNL